MCADTAPDAPRKRHRSTVGPVRDDALAGSPPVGGRGGTAVAPRGVRPGLLDEVPPRLARPGRPLVRHGQDGRRLVQDVVHAQRLGGPRARRLRAAPLRPRPQQGGVHADPLLRGHLLQHVRVLRHLEVPGGRVRHPGRAEDAVDELGDQLQPQVQVPDQGWELQLPQRRHRPQLAEPVRAAAGEHDMADQGDALRRPEPRVRLRQLHLPLQESAHMMPEACGADTLFFNFKFVFREGYFVENTDAFFHYLRTQGCAGQTKRKATRNA